MRELSSRLFHFDVPHVERDATLKRYLPFLMRNKEMSRSRSEWYYIFVLFFVFLGGFAVLGKEKKIGQAGFYSDGRVFLIEPDWRTVRSRVEQ
jgi:hypothetical protein